MYLDDQIGLKIVSLLISHIIVALLGQQQSFTVVYSNMTKEQILEGLVICIDKPLNWTSFQVVNKVRYDLRKTFNIKKLKVGHAGTLDPLATGLLILCTGKKKQKRFRQYKGQIKTYTGTITLGATTPSYDLETEIDQRFDHLSHLERHD